jgi:hypothetical protein
MFHFDYVGKRGGGVFENCNDGAMVVLNGKNIFSFDEFLSTFALIENYKHPFTITTTAKRQRRLDKQLEKIGYVPYELRQLDFDFGDENAFVYGYYFVKSSNPFRHKEAIQHGQKN